MEKVRLKGPINNVRLSVDALRDGAQLALEFTQQALQDHMQLGSFTMGVVRNGFE